MRIDRSNLWLQGLGGVSWLIGAGLSATWMVHGGGIIRPLVTFTVWATGISFLVIHSMTKRSWVESGKSEIAQALRYGACSAAALAVGTLFCEYWPITITMAFMFAICRSFESEETAAYN